MKFAVVIGWSEDRRRCVLLCEQPLPADQATGLLKHWINQNSAPNPLFPVVQSVGLTNILRENRFKPTAEAIMEAAKKAEEASEWELSEDELKEMKENFERLQAERDQAHKLSEEATAAKAEVERLKTHLAELNEKSAAALKQNEAQLVKADMELASLRAEIAALKTPAAGPPKTKGEDKPK